MNSAWSNSPAIELVASSPFYGEPFVLLFGYGINSSLGFGVLFRGDVVVL